VVRPAVAGSQRRQGLLRPPPSTPGWGPAGMPQPSPSIPSVHPNSLRSAQRRSGSWRVTSSIRRSSSTVAGTWSPPTALSRRFHDRRCVWIACPRSRREL